MIKVEQPNRRIFCGITALLIASGALVSSVVAEAPALIQPHPDQLVLIENGPTEQSVLHANGRTVEIETETVWRYMCGSDLTGVTIDDLRGHVQQFKDDYANHGDTWRTIGQARSTGGLDIVWSLSPSVPPEAEAALGAAEQYIESQFSDPVTVSIFVNMFDFGNPNIIGSTGSNYASTPSWTIARNGLIADMDADDVIQNFLPTGSTIPVRFNGSSPTVTNQSTVRFTRANYNAAIGTSSGQAASMSFNTGFSFDYDPSNGVPFNRMCFQSVVVHEVGHALGFVSGADSQFSNVFDALDIFRFQFTDGTGDYNPDSNAEFQTRTRTVDYNNPDDDAISDIISAEYRMSDGDPNQASHFRTSVPGIMDPNLAFGETFYPNFYRTPDTDMFDAIGWDFPPVVAPSEAPYPEGIVKNRYISFTPNNGGDSYAYQVELTAGPGTRGVLGWVGAPDANNRSLVVDQAYYTTTWPTIVDLGDCHIVPVATYAIRGIPFGSDEGNPNAYSAPFEVSTIPQPGIKYWADSVGELVGTAWTPPNGVINFNDVVAEIQGFTAVSTAPLKTWVDLHPEVPNYVINFDDVFIAVLAFKGQPYPYSDPSDCPFTP